MIITRAGLAVGAGLILGIIGASALTRWLKTVLYGVAPGDSGSVAMAATIMAVIGLMAAWLPVRAAVRVAPAVAIRQD